MTSEFYAALGGALVGGLISLVLQFLNYWREDWVRKKERERTAAEHLNEMAEREATLAFSLLAKIGRAHTDIVNIRAHLKEGEARLRGVKNRMLASAMLPLASDPPKLSLTLDEMILARDLKNDQILNDVMNFTHVHAMYVDSMSAFRALRRDLAALTSKTDIGPDGIATSVFEGANASIAQIKQKEANDLVIALLGYSDKDFAMITNLFHDAQSALLARLGKERLRTLWEVQRVDPANL